MDAAVKHGTEGIGIWQWASNDRGTETDVVMAGCGDVPTLETPAAVSLIREHMPARKVRVIHVVNLMRLQPRTQHPHNLEDHEFNKLFTRDKPVIFAFHASAAFFKMHLPVCWPKQAGATRRRARSRHRSIGRF